MSHQTPPSMMLSAPFAGTEGFESGRIVERQGRDTRPHSGNSEGHHPEQRIIIGRDAGMGQIQTKTFEIWTSCRVSIDMGSKDASHGHLGGRYSFNGEQQNGIEWHAAGDDGGLVGAARVLVCTFTMDPRTLDLPVPNRECVDHGSRRIRCITW